MQNPSFTVVVPAFNAAGTIGLAVRSVLAQTEAILELIVVDDGSTDATADAALEAAAGDARFTLLRQDNAGVAAARNAGIARGRGTLVAFLDADDRWVPRALACHARAFAADPRLGLSFGQVRFFDPSMAVPGRLSAACGALALIDALGDNPLCTASNMVLRRAVLEEAGGFDAALRHAEDQELVARILATTGWTVAGIPAELVHYRTSAGGLSADLARMERGWAAMMDSLADRAPRAVGALRPQAAARFLRYLSRRALRTGRPGALRYLGRAFLASPPTLLAHDPRRSLLTLAGGLAAALLPARLLSNLVSR